MQIESKGRLSPAEVEQVMDLVEAATEHDGVRPLDEHVMLHLRYGGDEEALAVQVHDGEELAGYAHLDPTDPVEGPSGQLVVHPAFRNRGYGRALVERVLELSHGRLRLWAHGEVPGSEPLALHLGFERSRELWQMRRSLFAPLPPVALPDGVRLRTFEPGADDAALIKLNAKAFADHPEQGAMSQEDLDNRMREAWFDPEGFFLAVRDDRLVGFHWTKIHGTDGHAHDPIGEVYVVGVDPDEQGNGLGKVLTLAGLAHLRSRGIAQAMLYVDGDNAAAIRLYESLGFTLWDTDVMYRKTP